MLEKRSQFRYAISEYSQGKLDFIVRKEKGDNIEGYESSDSTGAEFVYELRHALPLNFRFSGYGDLFTSGISEQYFIDSKSNRHRLEVISSNISLADDSS